MFEKIEKYLSSVFLAKCVPLCNCVRLHIPVCFLLPADYCHLKFIAAFHHRAEGFNRLEELTSAHLCRLEKKSDLLKLKLMLSSQMAADFKLGQTDRLEKLGSL